MNIIEISAAQRPFSAALDYIISVAVTPVKYALFCNIGNREVTIAVFSGFSGQFFFHIKKMNTERRIEARCGKHTETFDNAEVICGYDPIIQKPHLLFGMKKMFAAISVNTNDDFFKDLISTAAV